MLLAALWRNVQVRFVYRRVLGEAGERTADPLGLVAKGSVWYLVAQVEDGLRTYRVSRISEAAVLNTPCRRPPEFDLAAYWEARRRSFAKSCRDTTPRIWWSRE